MDIVPFVHEGLGNSSYLVGLGDGRAILVDPDRSVRRYLDAARAHGWTVEAVFETHLHADFVSGAREIAAATGASLFLPRGAGVRIPHEPVDGSGRLTLDGVEIEALASPGHAPEHLSYVLRRAAAPPALFSGGSLIVGGAARTDLISPDLTPRLTRDQFRTLTKAFAAMPDETLLYPTHGGGSFCSAGSGPTRTSTLGVERASNPLLALGDEDAFVRWFPTTFPAAPAYFFRMRAFNAAGPRLLCDIARPASLSAPPFASARSGGLVIDVRPPDEFAKAHVPGSLSIAFRDAFAVWLGWLVPDATPLLFVTDGVPIDRVIEECLLVGYEELAGVLEGGIAAWQAAGMPVSSAPLIGADAGRRALLDGALALDVRERDEYAAGRIPGAIHRPLGELERRSDELPADRPIVAYCGHGERSATAISLLAQSRSIASMNL